MFDAAIIGGGLAGCLAAITLARSNHRVVLIEAGTYPRAKVCGEFLSPESVAIFEDAGFMPVLMQMQPTTINCARITAPDGAQWNAKFPETAVGLSRYALDEALFNYAATCGATTMEKTRVTDVKGDLQTGFTLSLKTADGVQSIDARTVIAAHGKHRNPVNTDSLQKRDRSNQVYVGLKRHFSGPPVPDRVDLHVFDGGYCGMSHVETGNMNVCLLVRQDIFRETVRHQKSGVQPFIEWMCRQNPYLGEWFAQATPVYDEWVSISQVSLSTKSPVADDILYAGDAAGMIAPLAGDGMAMALHSGKLAAQSVAQYLTGKWTAEHTKAAYTRTWQRTFAGRLTLGRALNQIMLRPPLLSMGLRTMNIVPSVGNFLIRQTRDLSLTERSI